MKRHKCKREGSKEIVVKGRPSTALSDYEKKYKYHFWKCPGFALTTEWSGGGARPGFLGYVGAEIEPEAVQRWKAFRDDFVKSASVKDESKRKSDFIDIPSAMRKRSKTDWI